MSNLNDTFAGLKGLLGALSMDKIYPRQSVLPLTTKNVYCAECLGELFPDDMDAQLLKNKEYRWWVCPECGIPVHDKCTSALSWVCTDCRDGND